jgi:two-component system response regulator MprA
VANLLLLLEDNSPLRAVTQLLLESHGYEVIAVEGAVQALALLHQGTRPQVILLDLMMPDMDGFQFREQQMKDPDLARIPVVVWSGHALSPADSQRLHGATVIPKPVKPSVILQLLGTLCHAR